jgi:hypothetical protein
MHKTIAQERDWGEMAMHEDAANRTMRKPKAHELGWGNKAMQVGGSSEDDEPRNASAKGKMAVTITDGTTITYRLHSSTRCIPNASIYPYHLVAS